MAKRRVWVPVKAMILVEVESGYKDKRVIFEDALGIAYETDLRTYTQDDLMIDEDEIENPLPELIEEWVED